MMLYILPIIYSFIISFDKRLSKSVGVEYVTFVYFCIFFTCGYMTGDDWRNYEFAYYTSNDFAEIGYNVLADIFRKLGFSYTFFRMFSKIILFYFTWQFMKKFDQPFYFVLMLFVSTYALYLYINDTSRNLFAYVLFLYACLEYANKRIFATCFLLLLGILFHFSIILVIPLLFVNNIRLKSSTLVIIFVGFNLILLSNSFLIDFLKNYVVFIPALGDKVSIYLNLLDAFPNLVELQGRLFSFGLLIRFFCFILLIKYRKEILSMKYGRMIFSYTFIYLLLFRLGVTIVVCQRFSYYFFIFYLLSYTSLLYVAKNQFVYKFLMLIISITLCVKTVTTSYRYVPYTNILPYVFRGYLSYSERENFNIRNTPYKDE